MANKTKEEQSSGAPPALFEHCVNVYKAMFDEARAVNKGSERSDDPDENTEELQVIVYEGFLTQLITGRLNLSVPYYTTVMQALRNMGCVRQLRRGGSTTPSQWELIYEPNLKAFMEQKPEKARRPTRQDIRDQRLDELEKKVRGLEEFKEAVMAFLAKQQGVEPVSDGE